jgi:hypothetical protein
VSVDLKAIRERAEKATPGPWHVFVCIRCDALHLWPGPCGKHDPTDADKEFIDAARSDIPALLEHIEELERELTAEYGLSPKWRAMQERARALEEALRRTEIWLSNDHPDNIEEALSIVQRALSPERMPG